MATFEANSVLFDYVERFRDLLSPKGFTRLLMELNRNDFLALLFLRRGEARMGDVAEYLRVPLNTATGIVARLQRGGLVERTPSPDDRRVILVSLSSEGRTLIRQGLAEWKRLADRVVETLSDEQLDLLFTVVDRVIEVMNEQPIAPVTAKPRRIPID